MKLPLWITLLGVMLIMPVTDALAEDAYEEKRQQMLVAIQQTVVMTKSSIGKDSLDKRVEEAMLAVPRHKFVPPYNRSRAYENHSYYY